jgi:hypothetical protein
MDARSIAATAANGQLTAMLAYLCHSGRAGKQAECKKK